MGGVFERFLLELLGGVSALFTEEEASQGESTLSVEGAILVVVSDFFIAKDVLGEPDLFFAEDPLTLLMLLVEKFRFS